jgi:uncharacterized surface protein with fasciclin (FAS1) repeats
VRGEPMRIHCLCLSVTFALSTFAGCAAPQAVESSEEPSFTLAALIHEDDSLTTFAALLGHEELAQTLKALGPMTVFAPTNEAFSVLPAGAIEALLHEDSRNDLKEFVGSLIAPGLLRWQPGQIRVSSMLSGQRAWISGVGEYGTFAGAPIIAAPSVAGNGLLYRTSVAPLPEGWKLEKDRIVRPARRGLDSERSYP